MANTSAGLIETFVIPAFSSNDFFSSSFNVSTSLSSRADGSPPLMTLLAVCISEHRVLTVLEQAAVVGCRAFVNFMNIIGYKPAVLWLDQDWWRWPSSTIPLLLFPHQDTSFSSSCIRLDAGLISVETKPPSSKQQEHTVAEAVTRSTMQLVQASFPHGQSCCSGLTMVGTAPVRRLEEGQYSRDVQLPCLV
eukprot:Em0020g242a